jgi:MFS family permease
MDENTNEVSKKTVLFITILSSFINPFMASSVNIALPTIGKEFSMNAVSLSWVATAYLLTSAVFLVPFGKIADIYGRKKVYTWGIFVYGISSLAMIFAPFSWMLISLRALQGIGGAMIFGTSVAILTSVYPANERGKVLGWNVAAVYLGLSSGPFLGGILTHQLGWRSVFVVSTVFSLLIIPFIFFKLKQEWADAKGEKFDFKGSIVYIAGLFLVMYGFPILNTLTGIILVLSGIFVLAGFFILENYMVYPVLNLTHFKRNKTFIFSNLAAFINYSATFAVTFLLSLYLQYIKGFSPQTAGIIMVAQPITMAIFSPLAGRLSDRIEPRVVASLGMALTTIGLIPFIFLGFHTSVSYITIALIVIGTGFGLFSSPNTNAIMSSVERKYYGIASASVGTMRMTGQSISMGIAMLIFAMNIGKVKITPGFYPLFLDSTRIAFIIFTLLCSVGIFASLVRGKIIKSALNA